MIRPLGSISTASATMPPSQLIGAPLIIDLDVVAARTWLLA